MRISVVIRALNEEQHIGRLLTGLSRQSRPVDEVVLVDSGSTDTTKEIADRFGAKIVEIDPASFSFGRSLNLGLEATSGDIAVIPSAHVYPVHDGWISRLVAPFEEEDVGLTYGRQLGDRVSKFSEHQVLSRWFPDTSDLDQNHPFCNNANAGVRRAVWEQHRYDEALTGLEDLDFARRIQGEGWKIAYVAEAPVVHVHEESWRQIVNRYRREAIAHQRIFNDQRMPITEAGRLIAMNVAADVGRAAREGVLRSTLGEIIQFRIGQFLGSYLGFRQTGPVTTELKRRFYYPPESEEGPVTAETVGGEPIEYGERSRGDG